MIRYLRFTALLIIFISNLYGRDKVQVNGTHIFISKPQSFVFSGWKNFLLSGKHLTWIYFQDVALPKDMTSYLEHTVGKGRELKHRSTINGFDVTVRTDGKFQSIHAVKSTDGNTWMIWFHSRDGNYIDEIVKDVLNSAEYRKESEPFMGHGGIPYSLTVPPEISYFGMLFESICYTHKGIEPSEAAFWLQVDRSGSRKKWLYPHLMEKTLQGLMARSFLFGRCQMGEGEKEIVENGERVIEAHHFKPQGCGLSDVWFFVVIPEHEDDIPVLMTFGIRAPGSISKDEMVRIVKSYQPIPDLWKPDTDYQ